MYQDAIIVPMNEPISFRFNDYLFDMSLNDLLIANGILIHDHTSCRDMLGEGFICYCYRMLILAFLNSCGFAIHHDLSEYLMGTYGPNISGNAATSKKGKICEFFIFFRKVRISRSASNSPDPGVPSIRRP